MFGSRNERILRRMEKMVQTINIFEVQMQALSDQELAAKTAQFKARITDGETLNELLAEAFAVVREVALRTLGLRHFDVQLIGGIVLHEGNIAEMRTGEGKTLAATLPAYLNALTGSGVHIVTVNDYLAKRDSQWMKPIFEFLGLSIGVIYPDMAHAEKQSAYKADIVYGTNNEFGFDYLRDNMAFSHTDKVQQKLHFAIVDEVDSILIDEARTPLIISGAAEGSSELYKKINTLIPFLQKQHAEDSEGHYNLDEKQKQAHLTESGHQFIEELLIQQHLLDPGESLYHPSNIILMHHVNAALRAHTMFHRDVDYIVKDDQIVIVDEHTGRTLAGRRWSEGLHQAIEAKEGVSIQNENQTLASITFQNYFRLYDKLAGMTGTADTEAYEFQQIYNLEVVVIPTNQPMRRTDLPDVVYLTQQDKYTAIIEDIKNCVTKKRPVLVGTASIEASELLSTLLNKANIKHQVLNAKFHEKEAQIIAEAGRPGAVTIATNMAGRGTDIVLGGNLFAQIAQLSQDSNDQHQQIKIAWQKRHDEVVRCGGLHIIGSERHESRRIDNQLRGRAGRQGDPGSSRFYLSLEDNLMRIFASDRVTALMRRLGMQPGEPIEHSLVTRAIENAQRKLEGYHFDIRKQLLDYDNVANEQRQVIYTQRASFMSMHDFEEIITLMRRDVLYNLVSSYIPPQSLEEQWDISGLSQVLNDHFKLNADITQWINDDHNIQAEQIYEKVLALSNEHYKEKIKFFSKDVITDLEKSIILQTLDFHWREHLAAMDHLRQGIHLRGYAQKDPKQEYKREAFTLFSMMLDSVKYEIIRLLCSFQIDNTENIMLPDRYHLEQKPKMQFLHPANASMDQEIINNIQEVNPEINHSGTFKRTASKIGRNAPCPCGSGKKYKSCHGSLV